MHLVLCWAICLFSPPRAEPQEMTVGDIIRAWEAGCESIVSYQLNIQFDDWSYVKNVQGQYVLIDDHSQAIHQASKSLIARSGKKRRGEFHLDESKLKPTTMIQDGEKSAIIDPNRKSVSLQQSIVAFSSTQYEDYEATYRMLVGSTSRIDETRKRECKQLPREGKLFVLDVPYARDLNQAFYNFCWRIWLDPDKNFMPVRIEEWYDSNGTKVQATIIENTLGEVAPGIWAPTSSTRKRVTVHGIRSLRFAV